MKDPGNGAARLNEEIRQAREQERQRAEENRIAREQIRREREEQRRRAQEDMRRFAEAHRDEIRRMETARSRNNRDRDER